MAVITPLNSIEDCIQFLNTVLLLALVYYSLLSMFVLNYWMIRYRDLGLFWTLEWVQYPRIAFAVPRPKEHQYQLARETRWVYRPSGDDVEAFHHIE